MIADVSRPAEAQRIVHEAVAAFGGVDCLVASAGIQTYGTVVSTDEETWDRTLAVNAKGVYLAAKYCIPEMVKRGGGAIVNVASVQGLFSQPNVAAYAASKGAVIAMTRTMANRSCRGQYPRQQHLPRFDRNAAAALRRRADAAGRP